MFQFTFLFWLLCGKARNAVAANLGVILEGSHPLMNQLRAFRVFWNFAWTMTDVMHVQQGADIITWEVAGKQNLNEMEQQREGAVLMTAHMGSYDVAAPVFAHHFSRPVHMVRAPERDQASQEFRVNQQSANTSGQFVIHFNTPGGMLGVELARAISEGGVVAIQGDRILFDVSSVNTAFKQGVSWNVPRGPFTLALVSRAKIYPVFIIRQGYRRYKVLAGNVFSMTVTGRDKEKAVQDAAANWTSIIRPVIEKHWYQWFVFEPVFKTESAPES